MGAPLGNTNGRKARLFEQALTREIKQRDLEAGDGETLRKVAAQLVDKALKGDLYAARELMDRLDGRPAQTIQGPDGESVFGPMVGAAEGLRKKLR